MATFRPSCVVNLKLTFDEALHIQTLEDPRSVEEAVAENNTVPTVPRVEPLVTRRGDENVSFVMGRIPESASVELPGYRQAGQFSLDFDFAELPIDPRTVRSCAAEIYLGAISNDDFAAGMRGREQDGSRRSVLRTRDADGLPNTADQLIVGIVDEWEMEHSSDGSTVHLRGRDLRGMLIDTPINVVPNAINQLIDSLDLSRPIDEVVAQILDFNPAFSNIDIRTNPDEWTGGIIPAPAADDLVPRHRQGARGNRGSGRGTPNAGSGNVNFWDLIVRFSYLVGAIPFFMGTDLWIRPSRSLFDQQRQGFTEAPAPFRADFLGQASGGAPRFRDAETGQAINPPLTFRRIVYGRDTDSISFNRKYGGFQRPRVVRAISVDTGAGARGAGRLIVGVWPPEEELSARRTRTNPGGQGSQEEVINVPVMHTTDPARLQEIARATFEEIGRGEMGGTCQTHNLASFGGSNADPDLIRLRPGDAIELLVDARVRTSGAPLVSTFTDHSRASFEERVAEIRARLGGNENLARVIVATSRGQVAELQRFFRVANVKFSWGLEGVEITFDFQNYVVIRNQVGDQLVDEGETRTRTTGRRRRREPSEGEAAFLAAQGVVLPSEGEEAFLESQSVVLGRNVGGSGDG